MGTSAPEMRALVLDDVHKEFGDVRAVEHLSANIERGAIYGFLGPNGAGKTTTIRMIMNIIPPDSGRIEIMGEPPGPGVSSRVGYMPEERGLYRKMKVRALLLYFAQLKGMASAAAKPAIDRWLHDIQLSEWAERRTEDLSKGMQQKLQFALTAINDPELLILDEPFSALDPVNVDLVIGILKRMRAEGKTIILSTHIMEQAEQLCDHILFINKGRKVLDGDLDEIRGRYKTNSVIVEMDGANGLLDTLPMVTSVTSEGRRRVVLLRDGTDSQDLLSAIVGAGRLRLFEEKRATLHEIFVRLVEEGNRS